MYQTSHLDLFLIRVIFQKQQRQHQHRRNAVRILLLARDISPRRQRRPSLSVTPARSDAVAVIEIVSASGAPTLPTQASQVVSNVSAAVLMMMMTKMMVVMSATMVVVITRTMLMRTHCCTDSHHHNDDNDHHDDNDFHNDHSDHQIMSIMITS